MKNCSVKKVFQVLKRISAVVLTLLLFFDSVGIMRADASWCSSFSNWNKSYSLDNKSPGEKLAAVAVAQEGKSRSDLGYSVAWCAYFIEDCAELAGVSSSIPKTVDGYAYRVRDIILSTGGTQVAYSDVQVGDIITVDWAGAGGVDHVEIVYKVIDGLAYTVSGNTGNSPGTVKVRNKSSSEYVRGLISGVYRPNYVSGSGSSSLSINPTTCPSGTLTYGNSFSLQGTVSSNYPISYFEGIIYNSAREIEQIASCAPNSYSVNIRSSAINQNLIFNNLEAGSYYLHYYATDSSGASKTWYSDWFTISGGSTKPSIPTVSVPKSTYEVGDSIPITWNAVAGNVNYKMDIYKDGSVIVETSTGLNTSYTYANAGVGSYTVYVSANNSAGTSGCSSCSFTVVDPVPGKPALKNMKSIYTTEQTVSFTWDETENTTHYNLYIDRQNPDESWTNNFKVFHYAENGMTLALDIGTYRVTLQSTNSNRPGPDGTGWAYTNGDAVSFTVKEPYDLVSFEPNPGSASGGTVSPATKVVRIGEPYGALPIPFRSRYRFVGWCTSSFLISLLTPISSETIVTNLRDHTLYAKWQEVCTDHHTFVYEVTTQPTEDAPGVLTGICSGCQDTTSVGLPILNDVDYTISEPVAPSCTDSGIKQYTWNNNDYGSFSFDVVLPMLSHSFISSVSAPTCTAEGYTTHRCSRCGESYVDSYVEALGHAYENGYCIRCGEQDPDFEAAPAPIVISDLDIRCNISLGAELVVNYRLVNNAAFKAYGFDRFWMEFVRHNLDGTDSTTRYGEGQEAALVVNGARSFDLKNRSIPAAELGVGYTVRFHGMKGDQEYVTEPITGSMKDYFVSILETVEPEDNRGEEQLRLAADTLLYAAKAQTVFGIDPEHPILAGLSEAAQTQLEDYGDRATPAAENHIAFLGEGLTKPVIRLSLQDRLEVTIRYTSSSSAGLENVQVQFWPDGDESAKQCIPASLNGRTWTAVCSDIGAGRVKDLYHFVVLADGAPISSEAIWSVESYVAASRDSAEASMRELLNAVLNYGLAVINAF